MTKRKINLSSVTGWSGNTTAFSAHTVTVDLPVGVRYHRIWIAGHAGSGKKATDLIGEIRLNVNGKPQRRFTLTELLKVNALYSGPGGTLAYAGRNGNVAATAFYIPIHLAEPWRKQLGNPDRTA